MRKLKMTSYQIVRYLLLAANGLSVGLNVFAAIMSYNNEVAIIGWEWNALAAILSTSMVVYILSWEKG